MLDNALCMILPLTAAVASVSEREGTSRLNEVYVFSLDSEKPDPIALGEYLWLDGARVRRIECHFDRATSVEATAGSRTWSFVVKNETVAELLVTDELREAWEASGRLMIYGGQDREVELKWRPQRLRIGKEGTDFSVRQHASAFVPGSGEWIEVYLGDITRRQVQLGVRTAEGMSLAMPRSVAPGDEVCFSIGKETYVIKVKRLKDVLIGYDRAEFQVQRRDSNSAHQEVVRSLEKSEDERAIWLALTELTKYKLAKVHKDIHRAEGLLTEGKQMEGRAALEEARRSGEEAKSICHFSETLASRWGELAGVLSVVKIRVLRERRRMEELGRRSPPAVRAWERFVDRVFHQSLAQALNAEVLEVYVVGRKFAPKTLMGRLHPAQKRSDLQLGGRAKLYQIPRVSGVKSFEVGREYWVALAPAQAIDAIPRLIGGGNQSEIIFSVRSP
jgi:hypothetical protein